MSTNITLTPLSEFDVATYPDVIKEVKVMSARIAGITGRLKNPIVISFLKNHSLKTEWLFGNENLVRIVTDGSIKIHHIERLFDAEAKNEKFIEALESYIQSELRNGEENLVQGNMINLHHDQGSQSG